jgi:hypothetical protein
MLSHFKELERIEKYGVLSHQLRASIGIESKDVIIGKFERALKLAVKPPRIQRSARRNFHSASPTVN